VSLFDDVWHSRWGKVYFSAVLHILVQIFDVQLIQMQVYFWQKLFRKNILLDVTTKPYLSSPYLYCTNMVTMQYFEVEQQ
jgi:hypothetical protein